ncbi:hypothetical protein LX81_03693 [Palleronia aestuarii]|uniref:Uncharacterized protein n=1 Tax=Palleronia aestuarii TaxID=568105 RepID=A0A2W7NGM9_9RHOB|nr:hypothetical protein LX81_03693 [Palleronia aestuarii]
MGRSFPTTTKDQHGNDDDATDTETDEPNDQREGRHRIHIAPAEGAVRNG